MCLHPMAEFVFKTRWFGNLRTFSFFPTVFPSVCNPGPTDLNWWACGIKNSPEKYQKIWSVSKFSSCTKDHDPEKGKVQEFEPELSHRIWLPNPTRLTSFSSPVGFSPAPWFIFHQNNVKGDASEAQGWMEVTDTPTPTPTEVSPLALFLLSAQTCSVLQAFRVMAAPVEAVTDTLSPGHSGLHVCAGTGVTDAERNNWVSVKVMHRSFVCLRLMLARRHVKFPKAFSFFFVTVSPCIMTHWQHTPYAWWDYYLYLNSTF